MTKGPRCTVATALDRLDDAARAEAVEALTDPTVYGTVVAKVLTRHTGVRIRPYALQRHRRGDCQCPSPTK